MTEYIDIVSHRTVALHQRKKLYCLFFPHISLCILVNWIHGLLSPKTDEIPITIGTPSSNFLWPFTSLLMGRTMDRKSTEPTYPEIELINRHPNSTQNSPIIFHHPSNFLSISLFSYEAIKIAGTMKQNAIISIAQKLNENFIFLALRLRSFNNFFKS